MPAEPISFITETLLKSEPFRKLGRPALDLLIEGARLRRVETGEILSCRGDRPEGMFLLAQGEVKLYLAAASGNERIVRIARSGDTFFEESVFADAPQSLTAQMTRDGKLLFLPRRVLLLAMAADPELARALMQRMSERIAELVTGMEQCEQRNGAQRVAHYLVKHASRASEAVEVRLSTSKQVIASQLNMTPESFSRVLNRFTREGFISQRGHRAIRLTDYSRLQSLAA